MRIVTQLCIENEEEERCFKQSSERYEILSFKRQKYFFMIVFLQIWNIPYRFWEIKLK